MMMTRVTRPSPPPSKPMRRARSTPPSTCAAKARSQNGFWTPTRCSTSEPGTTVKLSRRRSKSSSELRSHESMPLSNSADLPTGTATFLFTDIQGSTPMVQKLGIERWKLILDTHYEILREQFQAHDGREVNTEGDAFFIAFPQANEAVAACAAGQRALYS